MFKISILSLLGAHNSSSTIVRRHSDHHETTGGACGAPIQTSNNTTQRVEILYVTEYTTLYPSSMSVVQSVGDSASGIMSIYTISEPNNSDSSLSPQFSHPLKSNVTRSAFLSNSPPGLMERPSVSTPTFSTASLRHGPGLPDSSPPSSIMALISSMMLPSPILPSNYTSAHLKWPSASHCLVSHSTALSSKFLNSTTSVLSASSVSFSSSLMRSTQTSSTIPSDSAQHPMPSSVRMPATTITVNITPSSKPENSSPDVVIVPFTPTPLSAQGETTAVVIVPITPTEPILRRDTNPPQDVVQIVPELLPPRLPKRNMDAAFPLELTDLLGDKIIPSTLTLTKTILTGSEHDLPASASCTDSRSSTDGTTTPPSQTRTSLPNIAQVLSSFIPDPKCAYPYPDRHCRNGNRNGMTTLVKHTTRTRTTTSVKTLTTRIPVSSTFVTRNPCAYPGQEC